MSTRNLIWLLALALLLAACGGDDEAEPATNTPPPTVTPVPTSTPRPLPTNTPVQVAAGDIFDEAASAAQVDLAAWLGVSLTQIEIMDPDTALFLEEPELCPDVEPEDTESFYLYLRNEQNIYPYQYYTPSGADEDLVVERCGDILVDEEVLFIPTPDTRKTVIELVQADLRAQGINTDTGQYVVREMTWSNTALDCRLPEDQEPTPAVIEGYLIEYTLDGVSYEYHTDTTGEHIAYCAPPQGYASIDAFMIALKRDEMSEFEETDEVARYDGLDAEGVIVVLTMNEYRVGLFEFETPQAARVAAQQINDDRVSHIFVSGYVLAVQEENSQEVYSILLTYAEEVRAPISERDAETEEPE
jgi:hypothetical protein